MSAPSPANAFRAGVLIGTAPVAMLAVCLTDALYQDRMTNRLLRPYTNLSRYRPVPTYTRTETLSCVAGLFCALAAQTALVAGLIVGGVSATTSAQVSTATPSHPSAHP